MRTEIIDDRTGGFPSLIGDGQDSERPAILSDSNDCQTACFRIVDRLLQCINLNTFGYQQARRTNDKVPTLYKSARAKSNDRFELLRRGHLDSALAGCFGAAPGA